MFNSYYLLHTVEIRGTKLKPRSLGRRTSQAKVGRERWVQFEREDTGG